MPRDQERQTVIDEQREQIQNLLNDLRAQSAALQKATRMRAKLIERNRQLSAFDEDLRKLVRWLETLDAGVSAWVNSRQWKIGSAAGELYRRATFKPRVPLARNSLERTLRQFRSWQKSKDFSGETSLVSNTLTALEREHDLDRVLDDAEATNQEPATEGMARRPHAERETSKGGFDLHERSPFKVLFVLPGRDGGGAGHSVVQECQGMRELGVFTQIAVRSEYREGYSRMYPNVDPNLFHAFDSGEALIHHARDFDIAVSSVTGSMKLLKLVHESVPKIVVANYVQAYGPWLFKEGSAGEEAALASYTAIPNMLLFAKTDWMCKTVQGFHDVQVRKVSPSLDHSVYYPAFRRAKGGKPVKLTAMVRPKTPHRSPVETMQILKFLKGKYGDDISITTFGCEPEDLAFIDFPQNDFDHRGVLIREKVAEVLREADVFIDLSLPTHTAFGRTGLEAMACGCATVLPKDCGTDEYAWHRENALQVNTSDYGEMVAAVKELIENSDLRWEISRQAMLTAANYSIRKAVVSELALFQEAVNDNRASNGNAYAAGRRGGI